MGDVVNLRQARKRRDRRAREREADENRILHGRSKRERREIAADRERENRDLDGKQLETPGEPDGP